MLCDEGGRFMISGTPKRFADGEVIFEQGTQADQMYVVRKGKVRIYRDQDGKETTLATLKPQDFFGEMAIFDGKPRSASAQAIGETELEVVGAADLRAAIGDGLVWDILKDMSARIRETIVEIEKLSVQDTVRREHLANLPIRRNAYL
jgi:CRP/FNR family transcriptional regulator, cyclic AMP receptor protein